MIPFETDTYNPVDPELVKRVPTGERLTSLVLNQTAYLTDGMRWVLLTHWIPEIQRSTLVYPLPDAYGEDHGKAMLAFYEEWRLEYSRLRILHPEPEPPAPGSSALPALTKPAPRVRKVKLKPRVQGEPLPGLEAWV